ncbi:type VI secretion system baseplate subunit TssK [Francisella adeliensis]|uniref:Type VI secretion system-associated protein n=1 Tax=Francisella adeliensis TaxID=2007306 RepID=A0A2Z4Y1H4_9GAMM|nr:type VI secretion system baseplate subunit TssK [Francisella adeliensis]AXA34582.1 hypothetical protein CDH04_09320 [Francisella adeliensis]MBK2086306.1 hypothetical protein [Francisella adeliensis]MBK2096522.1 hypothetical protein [Francisella adeliensis]QIW12827.1 hypothetical protein FZC43_09335 [Francisella adeliensis]QIW14704.1 hypothetical protein FZC44_09325 [Francisella adeliensis]
MPNVHWHLGQTLSPNHFRLQQDNMSVLSNTLLYEVNNLTPGIYQLKLKDNDIDNLVINVEELVILLDSGESIILGKNAKINSYKLNVHDNSIKKLDVYLNIKEKKYIDTYKYNSHDIKVEYYDLFISDSYSEQSCYSIKVFELDLIQDTNSYSICKSFIPKLSALPYLYRDGILPRLMPIVDHIHCLISKNISSMTVGIYKYQLIICELSKIDFWLKKVSSNTKSIHFNEIQKYMVKLLIIVSLVQDKIPQFKASDIEGDGYHWCLSQLDRIEKAMDDLLSVNHRIITLTLSDGIYKSPLLPREFFMSKKKYIVFEGLNHHGGEVKASMKLFSPVDIRSIMTFSSKGVEMRELDKELYKKTFPLADLILEIHASGTSWINIFEQKLLCLTLYSQESEAKAYLVYE